jgi:hypothetical protein
MISKRLGVETETVFVRLPSSLNNSCPSMMRELHVYIHQQAAASALTLQNTVDR